MDRRTFMATGSAGLLATQITAGLKSAGAEPQIKPKAIPTGKDASLKVIANDPLVLETPDQLLAATRITPNSALFVRNHHGAKHLADMLPRPMEGTLKIVGLVDAPVDFSLVELTKLAKSEVEMVLQCSGNFRAQFSKISPIKGTPWDKGGIGNVRFGGFRFSEFLKAAKLKVHPDAKFVTAEGADQPEKEGQVDYEKSVPLDVLMARGLLATEMNGVPLPAVHGGPLRLVIPGYYGNVQVKWLSKLRFEGSETSNFFQIPDYRTPKQRIVPGSSMEYTFDNSEPNFDMKINSRIFVPMDQATVVAGQATLVVGVAWNDGTADLTTVEISKDQGETWSATRLAPSAGPFAFREWTTKMSFEKGEHSLWARAVDAAGRTQPLDGGLFWNPGGYGWNGIEKIRVTAT